MGTTLTGKADVDVGLGTLYLNLLTTGKVRPFVAGRIGLNRVSETGRFVTFVDPSIDPDFNMSGKWKGRRRRSREYNRMSKGVLGIAAQAARRSQDNELALYGAYRQAQGKIPSIVRRDLSRKIAVIAWSLLKKREAYRDQGGRAPIGLPIPSSP